jgi:hypothetical protein
MSEIRESGLNATGVLSNEPSFVQRVNDVLSRNITDNEKEQLIRQMLTSQVSSDSYTVPQNRQDFMEKRREDHGRGVYKDKFPYRRSKRNMFDVINEIDNFHQAILPSSSILDTFDVVRPSTFGRGRRFIGPFDLMDPVFFGSSRLQYDVDRMFDKEDLQECKLEQSEETEEAPKHLKFTSKVVSIDSDGIKRTRVVNGCTKYGKDGKPTTHKKMISSDETGKTITEVFADGTERTTKRPFIKGKEEESD